MPPKKGVAQKRDTKSKAYLRALQSGVTKKEAMRIAGFSPNASSGAIDKLPSVRKGLASIEKQREILQQDPVYSFTAVAGRFAKRATNKKVNPNVQTINDKALVSMMGYDAPAQVNVKSMGLIMELSDLTRADIEVLRDEFGGG